ncbi:hypothetical protein AMELA_G00285900 [Ameiurus melas]|uniref:Immunoglobulin C1-set domain-containing protein n=1 Tax=Ameiurus melas TaxID=219545 RepID=A0A7J5ZII4_AMEME|nr:hypothetical protein AMELA_G00285900 [Ameiurus melas]
MHLLLSFVVLAVFSASAFAKESPPKTQVYSRNPGEFGKENTLICHVSDFHPPDITIDLLKNGAVIPGAKQTDLAFEKGWKLRRPTPGSQTCKPPGHSSWRLFLSILAAMPHFDHQTISQQ